MKHLFNFLLLFALLSPSLPAQFGFLDGDFDADGIKILNLNSNEGMAAVAVRPDGMIIVAGSVTTGGETEFLVMRLTQDGSIDMSFNGIGYQVIDFDPGSDNSNTAADVLVEPNGKIVVAGTSFYFGDEDFAIARLLPDGGLDSSFYGSGLKTIHTGNLGWNQNCLALARDASGYYYLGGTHYLPGDPYKCMVAKLAPTGAADFSFGESGIDTFSITGSNYDFVNDLIVLQDGRIVVGGQGGSAFDNDFVLAMIKTNGDLDSTFSTDGRVATNVDGPAEACYALAQQPDGKIIAAGYAGDFANGTDLALVRYSLTGSLDLSFDVDGKMVHDLDNSGSDEGFYGVVIQPDGKIIAGGNTYSSGTLSVVARYNSNGSPDGTFGSGGYAGTEVSPLADGITEVALQPDLRLVAVGNASGDGFAVRYVTGLVLSTPEVPAAVAMTLYPNPAQEVVTLRCQLSHAMQAEVLLTDVNGRILHTFDPAAAIGSGDQEIQLNLPSGLAPGNYLVVLVTAEGNFATRLLKN